MADGVQGSHMLVQLNLSRGLMVGLNGAIDEVIARTVERCEGNMRKAAKLLKVSPNTVCLRMQELKKRDKPLPGRLEGEITGDRPVLEGAETTARTAIP